MGRYAARIAVISVVALCSFGILRDHWETRAQNPVQIRLGTIAPSGSSFHMALVDMGQKWRDMSAGSVKLTIYPDNTQGGEAAMVQKMRANILTAGLFTVVGLSDIDPSVGGLFLPPCSLFAPGQNMTMSWRSCRPAWKSCCWTRDSLCCSGPMPAGCVSYPKLPPFVRTISSSSKIFTWAGNANQVDLMKALGYHPVPLETADILPGLRTNLINAIPLPPNQAMLGQCYTVAKNMLALKWTVLSGAAIIRQGHVGQDSA